MLSRDSQVPKTNLCSSSSTRKNAPPLSRHVFTFRSVSAFPANARPTPPLAVGSLTSSAPYSPTERDLHSPGSLVLGAILWRRESRDPRLKSREQIGGTKRRQCVIPTERCRRWGVVRRRGMPRMPGAGRRSKEKAGATNKSAERWRHKPGSCDGWEEVT